MNEYSLSRGLAFFSLGLGIAELLAPRRVARFVGVDRRHARLIQLLGVREIGAGLGILQYKPSTFLWSRVAGDVMDIGLLAAALRDDTSDRRRVKIAIGAAAVVTALDLAASVWRSRDGIDPAWRVAHRDRSGITRRDPMLMRAEVDEARNRPPAKSHIPLAHQTTLSVSAE